MSSVTLRGGEGARRAALLAVGLVVAVATVLAPAPAFATGTITVEIQGQGQVTGPGIDCLNGTGDCSELYEDEEICIPDGPCLPTLTASTELAATAVPGSGFAFSSWSGCDSPALAVCVETVNTSKTITAVFTDDENPIVTGLAPSGGVHDGTITLGAAASDNAAVQRVEFSVRGVTVGIDTVAPYQAPFNTAGVADGVASIAAIAYDTSGRTSPLATTSITIDNTVPVVSITAGPNNVALKPGTTQTWAFGASDANLSSVQCSVVANGQPASYGACSGGSTGHSVTGLAEGTHRFFVRATDHAGLEDVEERTFRIDGTAPQTILDRKPRDRVVTKRLRARVRFEFHSNEAAATFRCRIDSRAWRSCTSPKYYRVRRGDHIVRIRAIDQAGNRDATPSVTRFRVIRRR